MLHVYKLKLNYMHILFCVIMAYGNNYSKHSRHEPHKTK